MGLFEAVLIGKSTIFGFALFGGPVLYLYRSQINENLDEYEEGQREIAEYWKEIEEEATKAREILDDYSFKIFLPCSTSATGWILDYELTEDDHYPRTWYIATNAHVANHFRFANNDYHQKLPTALRDKSQTLQFPNFSLTDDRSCDLWNNKNYFDFNLSKQANGREFGSNHGGIVSNKMEEPKLFYAPIDFLKEDSGVKKDHYKDFAVIEVEFKTEGYAREATREFYDKYKEGGKTPLNVFESPLDKEEQPIDYYSLGYEGKKGFNYTFSYHKEDGLTSQLVRNTAIADEEGRVSAQSIDLKNHDQMTDWDGKKLNRFGHFYLLENFAMAAGASGGLVIDADGNVLGVRSMGTYAEDQTLVVPLKSKKITGKSFETPEYDLINGSNGQKSSYRQQVEEYIFNKKKKNTWLSKIGKWKEEWEKKQKT